MSSPFAERSDHDATELVDHVLTTADIDTSGASLLKVEVKVTALTYRDRCASLFKAHPGVWLHWTQRRAGLTVAIASRMGKGFPDLLVADAHGMWLVEVKSKGGKLRASQERFQSVWPRPVVVLRTVDDVLQWVRSR